MEENNKPEQNQPNEEGQNSEAVVETQEPEIPKEQQVRDNVKESIRQEKDKNSTNPILESSNVEGSDTDVSSPESSPQPIDVDKSLLEELKNSTGRDFKNTEDVTKYIKNLNSLVGDQTVAKQRDDAKLLTGLVDIIAKQQDKSPKQAKESLESLLPKADIVQQTVQEPQQNNQDVEEVRDDLQDLKGRLELSKKYPDSSGVVDNVAIIAKQKGISYVKAYEQDFKDLVDAKVEGEAQKSPVVASNSRIGLNQKKVQDLGAKVIKFGSTEEDKIALVKEVLGDK